MAVHEDEDISPFVAGLRTSYYELPARPQVSAVAIRRNVGRRRRRRRRLGIAAVAVLTVAGVGVWSAAPWTGSSSQDTAVMSALPQSEAWSSWSAADWVDNADAVAVVEVVSDEKAGEFPAGDGSGDVTIGRLVDLSVKDVMWKRAAVDPPTGTVRVQTYGWVSRAGSAAPEPLAVQDVPRLEAGHEYVVALRDVECRGEAAATEPGSWRLLGSGGTWPSDGGVIGAGESAGKTVSPADAEAAPGSFEAKMTGRSPGELRAVLEQASDAADTSPLTC